MWLLELVVTSADVVRLCSYNRLLAISGRVLRRSLKEDKRIAAERRGESELRVAFWKVCITNYARRARNAIETDFDSHRMASSPRQSPSTK
jgi:hypothetical protein